MVPLRACRPAAETELGVYVAFVPVCATGALPPMGGPSCGACIASKRSPSLSEWRIQFDTSEVCLRATVVARKCEGVRLVYTTSVAGDYWLLQVFERTMRGLPDVNRIPPVLSGLYT